jgi:hypothetical protein
MRMVCTACSRQGHSRNDYNDFERSNGLVWKPINLPQYLDVSASPAFIENRVAINWIDCPVSSSRPIPPASPISSPQENPALSPALDLHHAPIAKYELNPEGFVLAGHHIIDGGALRLPRTFITPPNRAPRHHEDYMVSKVVPAPPASALGPVREEIIQFCRTEVFWSALVNPGSTEFACFKSRIPQSLALSFSMLHSELTTIVLLDL